VHFARLLALKGFFNNWIWIRRRIKNYLIQLSKFDSGDGSGKPLSHGNIPTRNHVAHVLLFSVNGLM